MNIGSPLLIRFGDHGIDQPHQGVVGLFDGFFIEFVFGATGELDRQLHRVLGLLRRAWTRRLPARRGGGGGMGQIAQAHLAVGVLDAFAYFCAHAHNWQDFALGGELQVINDPKLQRIGHRHHQRGTLLDQRQHLQALRHGKGNAAQGQLVDRKFVQADKGVAHFAGKGDLQIRCRDQPFVEQQLPQWLPALVGLLPSQHLRELLLRDFPQTHQGFAYGYGLEVGLPLQGALQIG